MSNVRVCADCTTQYALGLNACPHCGSSNTAEEEGVVTRRLPLFVTLSCTGCGRGPWTLRLESVTSGLIELPTLGCASCGCRVPVTWPPEEEPVTPKITVHGGPTNARDADVSPAADASQPLVGAEADQGRPTSVEAAGETSPEVVDTTDDVTADDLPASTDYEGMTLAELRTEADSRGLPSYGTKAQITERLREADTPPASEDSTE